MDWFRECLEVFRKLRGKNDTSKLYFVIFFTADNRVAVRIIVIQWTMEL